MLGSVSRGQARYVQGIFLSVNRNAFLCRSSLSVSCGSSYLCCPVQCRMRKADMDFEVSLHLRDMKSQADYKQPEEATWTVSLKSDI